MHWEQALKILSHTHEREQQKQLLALLQQDVANDRLIGAHSLDCLDAAYQATRDAWLSSELKRLQNRVKSRQVLGRDLLRLNTPPVGDNERKKLWEDLKSLQSTYEGATGDEESLAGKYDLREKIGQGGMSVVFRAIRLSDQKEVAIKYLRREYFDSPAMVARFRRECRLSLSFNHPNIVKTFEVGQHDPGGFMVMEFLPLGGMDKYLGHPHMNPWLSISVIGQALQALTHIHAKNVVHRDIKLSNLLVSQWAPQSKGKPDEQIRIKLTDFGLSKELPGDGLTTVGTRMGTDLYMAPEQRESPGDVDQRADIYAMGVCLYRLMSGKGFPEGDYPLLHELHTELPVEMDHLLKKCLKQNPDDRYASSEELLWELEALEKKET